MPGSRIFAALYDRCIAASAERILAPRREFAAGGAKGRVLEVGAGTGANLKYYRFAAGTGGPHTRPLPHTSADGEPGPAVMDVPYLGARPPGEEAGETGPGAAYARDDVTELTLTDISPHMLRRLGAKLARQGITAKVIEAGAEKLPFPDASFDTVVITLALCSVRDLSRSLAEVKRVLKPDGELRFIEHVRSDARGWACFQKVIKPIHTRLGDGCQPDRATVEAIGDEGFEIVELQRFKLGPYPTRPFVMGVARKPAELVRASH